MSAWTRRWAGSSSICGSADVPVRHGDDPAHLLAHQYADSRNLSARMVLHERFSENRQPLRGWLFDRLADVPPDARVLEVGCGPGTLWVENRERIPAGWRLHLTDFSPGMAAEASAALAAARITAQVSVADACRLPFADGSADLVLAHGMLYHVADRPQALAELRRVLADGGRLHAWTVGEAHLRELDALVRRLAPELDTGATGSGRFGLENGAAQLAAHFHHVYREDYPDGLWVTEVEPLVDYVRSWGEPGAGALARLRAEVGEIIARDGGFRVTKSSGLFICS
jgi:SAM-dependent methyltransferase